MTDGLAEMCENPSNVPELCAGGNEFENMGQLICGDITSALTAHILANIAQTTQIPTNIYYVRFRVVTALSSLMASILISYGRLLAISGHLTPQRTVLDKTKTERKRRVGRNSHLPPL
jgi:hypothetical protein